MEFQVGDIVLVHGDSWIGKEIEEVEKNKYSHTAIIVKQNVIVEAGAFDVRFNALDSYTGQADIYRCNDLDNFQKAQICDYVVKQIGKKYDYPLLIWEFIRYKLNIVLPYFNTDSVICSELISDAFRKSINVDLCPNIRFPSPADLSLSKSLTLIQSI